MLFMWNVNIIKKTLVNIYVNTHAKLNKEVIQLEKFRIIYRQNFDWNIVILFTLILGEISS